METAAAAAATYEGGYGGKFRKRPNRRAASTPYDRPPTAARAALLIHTNDGEQNGWLSKLVDPASRIIAKGASRLFSSVFRKRLGAPPPPAEAAAVTEDVESGEYTAEVISFNPSPRVQDQGGKRGESSKDNADDGGISELEHLLEQKTFSRDEFDHLTELLRSRTIDLSAETENKRVELHTSQAALQSEKQENASLLSQDNGIKDSKLFGNISASRVSLNVPEEEAASPTELAKAYMVSRPSKPSPYILNLRSQVLSEVAALPTVVPFASKASGVSVTPRSTNRSGPSENGYWTPRRQGRSALYTMTRSPYFKTPSVPSNSVFPPKEGYLGTSTSYKTPSDVSLSIGKQVLKRRSSDLDDDLGSVGPIRRIRQKSNMVSPSKEIQSFSGKHLSTPFRVGLQGSTSSMQKPHLLNGLKCDTSVHKDDENGEDQISRASLASVPRQSTQMANKILQQLDQLVPSPKEKFSELKPIAPKESHFKLTFNTSPGWAHKSVGHKDLLKSNTAEGNDKFAGPSSSFGTSPGISFPQRQERVETDQPSRTTFSGTKLARETSTVKEMPCTTANAATVLPQDKSAFQMPAPEGSLKLDYNNYGSREASNLSITGKENRESSIKDPKDIISETSQKNPVLSSFESKGAMNFNKSRVTDNRGLDGLVVSRQDNGFSFPIASSDTTLSHPPLTPTMPTSSVEQLTPMEHAPPKEHTDTPVFSFGSKNASILIFPSTATNDTDCAKLKFSFGSNSKTETSGSTVSALTTAQVETRHSFNDKEREKLDSLKPCESFISAKSSSAAPVAFTFSAPSAFGLSNGSLKTTSSASTVSAASAASVFVNPAVPNLSTSSASTSGLSVPSVSESSPPSTFPEVPSIHFGSNTVVMTNDSVLSAVKCGSNDVEAKPLKEPIFGSTTTFSVAATSPTVSGPGSGIFRFNSAPPSTATFGSNSGSLFGSQSAQSGNGNSTFVQSSTNQSSPSPTLVSDGSSLFGFSNSKFGSSTSLVKPFAFSLSSGSGQSSSVSFTAGFGTGAFGSSGNSLSPCTTTSSLFSSSQPALSSTSGSGSGSSTSSTTEFSFGPSSTILNSSASSFSSSTGPTFSFTSAVTTATPATPATATPTSSAFGIPKPVPSSSGNDQMNVEDSMGDDAIQASMPLAPSFGQSASLSVPSNLTFGSPVFQAGGPVGLKFGSEPSPPTQSPYPFQTTTTIPQSPFQATGNLGFAPGGSFSLGSGGGDNTDKASRRMVKIKRDKMRKK